MAAVAMPINLQAWINENRHLLKPPVGNKCIFQDKDFIVMIVGGPNARKDYHVNPTEELFYQIEGDVSVRILEDGKPREIPIKQGEMFLLPANVPHSPQRGPNTIGMVVERQRPGQKDHLRWVCDKCGEVIHEPTFDLVDIAAQLKKVMEEFWAPGNEALRTCKKCGHTLQPPTAAK